MPKLRRLSGAEVIHILEHFGFTVHAQRGSHVKLRRLNPAGEKQTLTIHAIRNWILAPCGRFCDRQVVTFRLKN